MVQWKVVLQIAKPSTKDFFGPEMSKSIVKGISIGFLSCIGITKTISRVLVLLKSSSSIGHKPLIKPCIGTPIQYNWAFELYWYC